MDTIYPGQYVPEPPPPPHSPDERPRSPPGPAEPAAPDAVPDAGPDVPRRLADAERRRDRATAVLAAADAALLAARAERDAARDAADAAAGEVADLRARHRDQLVEAGLRQPCRWNAMYDRLAAWRAAHGGDTTVPCDGESDEDAKKLNRWVINQRTAYKYFVNGDKKHIKEYRVDALNKIGFIWSVADHLWDKNFEDLRRHHATHGTFNIAIKQNRKLAVFVSRLRTAMRYREQGLVQQELSQAKIDRLNAIGFTWALKNKPRKAPCVYSVQFEVMYEHLVAFKALHGHLKVNKLEKEWKRGHGAPERRAFRRLPVFLAYVRREQLLGAEGRPCALDAERVARLDALGVAWKRPASEPRKSTGGEATRKRKRPRAGGGGAQGPGQQAEGPPPQYGDAAQETAVLGPPLQYRDATQETAAPGRAALPPIAMPETVPPGGEAVPQKMRMSVEDRGSGFDAEVKEGGPHPRQQQQELRTETAATGISQTTVV